MSLPVRVAVTLATVLLSGSPGGLSSQPRRDPQPLAVSVRVDATRVANPIGPQLYGQFLEFMFEGIKFGLHAELLKNRGFEELANAAGLPRDWEREPNDRNDDRETTFARDDAVALLPTPTPFPADPSAHSLRLHIRARYDGPRGVRQSRIPLVRGGPYVVSFWLKSADYDGRVTVALAQDREGGRIYAAQVIRKVATSDWERYTAVLRPTEADPLAKLMILFDGKGRLWLDQVSLMPAAADVESGVRTDVYSHIARLRPAFIRYPGGNVAQDYHWQWGVGPRDRRPFWINKAWWSEREPGDFGTDEFLALCRRLRAEPHLVVNVEGAGATPEEAAAWVEYANGPPDSKYGAMRAANGRREPYGVKVWELGNEIWGDWVRGHSDAATYARNYRRYREAMLKVDPTLRFIAVGRDRTDWNDRLLAAVGPEIDLLSIHHYEPPGDQPDPRWLMARPLDFETYYRELGAKLRQAAPGRRVGLIVNEWNTVLPLPRQHSMEAALYAARLMNVFERTGDVVEMSAVSDLVNGWPGGIIQAGRHGVHVTPTYRAIELYNRYLGAERLAATVQGDTFDLPDREDVPFVDVAASRTADGRRYILKLVNTSFEAPARVRVAIDGWRPPARGTLHLLTAPTLHTANTFAAPDAVAVTTKAIVAGPAFTVDLPRHAVGVVVLERKAQH